MRERSIRWLLLFTMLGMVWPASATAALSQGETDDQYQNPEGRFSVPVPTGWTAEERDGYGLLTGPEDEIMIAALAVEAEGPAAGIATAWEIVEPGFAMEPLQEQEVPPRPGADDALVITYDAGQESGEVVQAVAEMVDGVASVLLIRADLIAAQERQAQINIIASGFDIAGLEEADLEGVEPLAFEGDLVQEFESYVGETLELLDVPGATVAIVQDGAVVYREAFGVTELGGDEPMDVETRMMIGSTTKSMTTMMLATLVDEGVINWDTPVVDILPSFDVADPELTPQITVQDLVCACTGVPRRDLELLFNFDDLTARGIVDSLAEFEFFTPIGEAFQYSNQMVAAAGYAGAAAVHGESADLYDAYVAEMRDRILGPIGMDDSTFSFEEIIEGGNYATPHGLTLDGDYVTIPIGMEEFVMPVAPSGGLWSNVDDMSRYILTQLARGTAPDGTEVVSGENLEQTWEPQVPVADEVSYGLGWFVEEYKGQPVIQHGGNTLGFTSDLAFLPDANLGIVVLTNGQGSTLFNLAVRYRMLELVFEQEPEFQAQVEAALEGEAEVAAVDTGVPAPGATPAKEAGEVDADELEPFTGEYVNEALGTIFIETDDGDLLLDAGEFQTELRVAPDAPEGDMVYLMVDPPVPGLPVELRTDDSGEERVIVGEGTVEYTFMPLSEAGATPAAAD